jgi:hypothetical protein
MKIKRMVKLSLCALIIIIIIFIVTVFLAIEAV